MYKDACAILLSVEETCWTNICYYCEEAKCFMSMCVRMCVSAKAGKPSPGGQINLFSLKVGR